MLRTLPMSRMVRIGGTLCAVRRCMARMLRRHLDAVAAQGASPRRVLIRLPWGTKG